MLEVWLKLAEISWPSLIFCRFYWQRWRTRCSRATRYVYLLLPLRRRVERKVRYYVIYLIYIVNRTIDKICLKETLKVFLFFYFSVLLWSCSIIAQSSLFSLKIFSFSWGSWQMRLMVAYESYTFLFKNFQKDLFLLLEVLFFRACRTRRTQR